MMRSVTVTVTVTVTVRETSLGSDRRIFNLRHAGMLGRKTFSFGKREAFFYQTYAGIRVVIYIFIFFFENMLGSDSDNDVLEDYDDVDDMGHTFVVTNVKVC
jgi:hypothetical protein